MSEKPLGYPTYLAPWEINGLRLETVNTQHPKRAQVEAFTHQVYKAYFHADLKTFMPEIIVCWRQDELLAAVGIRQAHQQKLFLEQYLEHPIEHYIYLNSQYHVDRRDIIEAGNLAVAHPGLGHKIIPQITCYLATQNIQWVAVTATAVLSNLFLSLGFEAIPLTKVDKSLDSLDPTDWGTYYQSNPTVLIGDLQKAYHRLLMRMPFLSNPQATQETTDETDIKSTKSA